MQAGEESGIVPCGLGARNTLRLEGALSLYGHEISESISVWEARLDRFIKMEKGNFIGREALEQAKASGMKRTLVGLESVERGIPRDGYKVHDLEGKEIGYVTSGSYAPFLKKNVALAYVPPEFSSIDAEVAVEIRNQPVKCKVVPIPFYKRPKKQS
jgi:aminomethyltransferase